LRENQKIGVIKALLDVFTRGLYGAVFNHPFYCNFPVLA